MTLSVKLLYHCIPGRYIIPSTTWDSDSDVWESDFDDEDAPSYFGDNLEKLYETMENRRIASPVGKGVSGQVRLGEVR